MCGVRIDIVEAEERVVRRQRLGGEDVERGTRQPALPKRRDQRRFVDHGAARDVDQHCRGLHPGNEAGIDEPAGLGRQRAAEHDDVALRRELLQRGALDPFRQNAFRCGSLPSTLSPKPWRAIAATARPTAPIPTMPMVRPASSSVCSACARPASQPPCLRSWSTLRKRRSSASVTEEDVLGHRAGVDAGHVGDQHARFRGGRHRDHVEPGAMADGRAQARRRGEQARAAAAPAR